jgi:putative transposase
MYVFCPEVVLRDRVRRLEKDVRVLNRLYFILYLYDGLGVEEACNKVGVVKAVGYEWLRRWNEGGYDGLVPRFGGGRPAKLSKENLEELCVLLREKDDWTLEEIKDLILEDFGVDYHVSQVSRILHGLGMKCGKPYQNDYRQPIDARDILKKPRRTKCGPVVDNGVLGRGKSADDK